LNHSLSETLDLLVSLWRVLVEMKVQSSKGEHLWLKIMQKHYRFSILCIARMNVSVVYKFLSFSFPNQTQVGPITAKLIVNFLKKFTVLLCFAEKGDKDKENKSLKETTQKVYGSIIYCR